MRRPPNQTFMYTARAVFLTLALSAAAIPAFAAAPAWDNTGNSMVSGTYYFRQVLYITDESGNTSEATSLFGNITFTPSTGTYSMTGLNYADSSSGAGATSNINGTYSVSSSGFGILSDALVTGANVQFLVSNHNIVGSSTESGFNDMFVATPTSSLSNASFTGSYTINGFYILAGGLAGILDGTFQLSPNGAGALGNVSISGHSAAGTNYTQSSSGVKYNFVNGANVITFPTNNNAIFYSGQVYMYMSPDGNFVFGGSPLGYDMFVGVKNAGSGTSTPLTDGLYYEAGLDSNQSVGLDSFYGSFNAVSGNIIDHQRIAFSESGQSVNSQGETFYDSYPTTISNTYQAPSGITQYTIGQSGIRIGYGLNNSSGAFPAIAVAMPYTPPGASGSVYLDPSGIVSAASSAPYTAGVSPGNFMTIYNGVNLANGTTFAPPGAFPTTLGGVQVIFDGVLPAPLYYVSATQISFLVPYEVSTYGTASIQVVNNGAKSNVATTYVWQTTPGVFTANPVGGYGTAAMLDFPSSGGYFIVSGNKPANPGDPVALYLTGLGTPFPSNPDGALGPTVGDDLVNSAQVSVGGTNVGNFAYSGLAPGLAGLYQINFTMPTLCGSPAVQPCITAGTDTLAVTGIRVSGNSSFYDSYSNEAIVPVSTGGTTASDRAPVDGSEPALAHPAAVTAKHRPLNQTATH